MGGPSLLNRLVDLHFKLDEQESGGRMYEGSVHYSELGGYGYFTICALYLKNEEVGPTR